MLVKSQHSHTSIYQALFVYSCMYICILAYNSGTGKEISSKFSGYYIAYTLLAVTAKNKGLQLRVEQLVETLRRYATRKTLDLVVG